MIKFLSVDDDQWEPDEQFFVKISLTNNEADADVLKIGRKHIMTIKSAQLIKLTRTTTSLSRCLLLLLTLNWATALAGGI